MNGEFRKTEVAKDITHTAVHNNKTNKTLYIHIRLSLELHRYNCIYVLSAAPFHKRSHRKKMLFSFGSCAIPILNTTSLESQERGLLRGTILYLIA